MVGGNSHQCLRFQAAKGFKDIGGLLIKQVFSLEIVQHMVRSLPEENRVRIIAQRFEQRKNRGLPQCNQTLRREPLHLNAIVTQRTDKTRSASWITNCSQCLCSFPSDATVCVQECSDEKRHSLLSDRDQFVPCRLSSYAIGTAQSIHEIEQCWHDIVRDM